MRYWKSFPIRRCAIAAIGALILAGWAVPAHAQIVAGGGRGKKPGKTPLEFEKLRAPQVGQVRARIVKVKHRDSDVEEGILGTLYVRPLEEGVQKKMLKLKIYPSEELRIDVAGHRFPNEELDEVLRKGTLVTVGWGWREDNPQAAEYVPPSDDEDKPARPTKKTAELHSVTLETMDVVGTIKEIEGDVITLKAKPKDDRPWPHLKQPKTSDKGDRTPAVRPLSIDLQVVQDVSKFTDGGGDDLSISDFEIDQEIEARIVYGKPGMLVRLSNPDLGLEDDADSDTVESGGRPGTRPPP